MAAIRADEQSGAKRVLIHALRDILPFSIANRKKKGFSLPYETWMRGPLAELLADTCSVETVRRRGLLDANSVAWIHSRRGQAAAGGLFPRMWTLMIFELWCRAVLDPYQSAAANRQPAIVAQRVKRF